MTSGPDMAAGAAAALGTVVDTVVETIAYRAPLAVLPVDDITGAPVPDGIAVTAWPTGAPAQARAARHSPISALMGFASLPGLWAQEHASAPGRAEPVWPAATALPFSVAVVDTLGRYLPQTLAAYGPVGAPVEVRLSSAPARPRPPGWAAVTGLVRTAPGVGAGWALVEVDDGATTYVGGCDGRGAFAVYLPYPEALPPLASGAPSGPGGGVLAWDLTLAVRYQPDVLRPVDLIDLVDPGAPSGAGPGHAGSDDIPEIGTIRAQAHALVVTAAGPVESLQVTLQLGQALALTIDVVPAAFP